MIQLDYTTCYKDAPENTLGPMPSGNINYQFKSNGNGTSSPDSASWSRQTIKVEFDGVEVDRGVQECTLQFNIPEDMGPPVFFYYHLTNFYQNHRRYVTSFYDQQLKGTKVDGAQVNGSACAPLTHNGTGVPYYPCGLIANSIFNDTFSSPVLLNVRAGNANESVYFMNNKTNIAWSSDKSLYGNFPADQDIGSVAPPPNWRDRYPNGYTQNNPPPKLAEDEAFMVWMRTAGLPTFSKLAQRNDSDSMRAGTYQVKILHCKSGGTPGTQRPLLRRIPSLPRRRVPGHEVHHSLHPHRHGRPQPVPRNRIRRRGRNMYPPWRRLHRHTHDQAQVLPPPLLEFSIPASQLTHPRRKLGDHTYLSWNNAPAQKGAAGGSAPANPSTAMSTGRDLGV
jgi:hypothetical protein